MMVFYCNKFQKHFMTKTAILFFNTMFLLAACNESSTQILQLQNRVDSLQLALKETYKPGLGEFMSSIQVHHEKLYFAGQNENWKLADFEIHEIMEAVDDIHHYATERPEAKELQMLLPSLDSVNEAIKKQDKNLFNKNFINLTNTCNECHKAVNYEFNLVKIPETPPFSNQIFKAVSDSAKMMTK
jgi:hypothetical protein